MGKGTSKHSKEGMWEKTTNSKGILENLYGNLLL